MILIAGTMRVPSENLAQAREALRSLTVATRAEPGCLDYAYSEDLIESGLVHLNERWEDQATLDAHLKTAHLAAWRREAARLGVGDRRLFLYEVDAGEPLP